MNRKIKDRLYIASCCGNWKSIARDFDLGVELDHFCQAENMDPPKREKIMALLQEERQRYRMEILHAPFNELHPAAIDPRARALAMERLRQAAELALELGIKKMVVHSGYVPYVYFPEYHVARSIEFWQEFMGELPADFVIAVENVMDEHPEMLAEIARGVGDPRVGVCYDIGHANLISEDGPERWLEVLAPYLKHLHIHNNDGERDYHRGLTEGTLDMPRILDRAIELCGEETSFTAEILAGDESFHWLREQGYL